MGVTFITDDLQDGNDLKKTIEASDLNKISNCSITIRWGNWTAQGEDGILLNTSQTVKNTLDKENLILMLQRSKVPCPRRIKPGSKTTFPIVGRSYLHKNGTDIRIIDNLNELKTCNSDYFLQYLNLTEEYRLHVMELEVFYSEEKYQKTQEMSLGDIVIRTAAYGWDFTPVDLNTKTTEDKENMFNMAVKAVYALGLDFGIVTLGKTAKGNYYVVDVDAVCKNMSEKCKEAYIAEFTKVIKKLYNIYSASVDVTIGADPECILKDKDTGSLVFASDFLTREGEFGLDDRSIESGKKFFPLVELRPKYSLNPLDVSSSIEAILTELYQHIHYKNIGLYSGSMPIYNYWLGGHIHFGIKPNTRFIRALDNYMALPMMMIEKADTARARKERYGLLGNFRPKEHGGFEYCTLSSWLISPQIARGVLCLAKLIAQEYTNLDELYLTNYSDIRAFYLVNKLYFQKSIEKIINKLRSTKTYKIYEAVLEPLLSKILKSEEWDEDSDIKTAWGISPSEKVYKPISICFVPDKKRRLLGIKIGQLINVKTRAKNCQLKILPKDDLSIEKGGLASFSEDVEKLIGLNGTKNVDIWCANDNDFRIGPVFGILADRMTHTFGLFGYQSYYFRKLIKLSLNKGMLTFVFSIWDLDWENKTVHGYTYDFENDDWQKRYFPIPDVIYDRGDYISENGYGQYAVEYMQNIKKYNIKLINSIECIELTNDKWESYKLLNANGEAAVLQPETAEYTEDSQILDFVNKYGLVYIKLKDGSRSKGILAVEKKDENNYFITHKNAYGSIDKFKIQSAKLTEKINWLIRESGYLRSSYIIQQGIKKPLYNDMSFELRIVMQKNSENVWLRTCMVARVNKTTESFLSPGYECEMKVSEIIYSCFGDKAEALLEQIRNISKVIVNRLDEKGIKAGEIAIDCIIDNDLNIYTLELNSKPDNLLSAIGAFKRRNIAVNRVLEYGRYLVFHDKEEIAADI